MGSRGAFREFEGLLDKSQRAFNKLRDLPPYGNAQWEAQFQKAFTVYSRLWKFQQDNRDALTARGLERWEVGDIASKIGQLYYNYYLRTGETRFLSEAHVFYEAVRSRGYFGASATDPNLAIKQLRYFARSIIVCLLLNRREEVWQLLQEFQALTSSYVIKYAPPDAAEWRAVIAEVTAFLGADVAMPAPRAPGGALPFRVSLRCGLAAPEVKLAPHRPLLLHAVIASYYPRQVKIAELPLDSFRMLQALEWEDAYSSANPPQGAHPMPLAAPGAKDGGKGGKGAEANGAAGLAAGGGAAAGPAGGSQYENPSKHLLYRPTALQLLSILTTTAELLPRDGLLLLYLSAASGRGGGELRGAAGAFASTSHLMSGDGGPEGEGGSLADNSSDASGLSIGALTVSNSGTETGLNLGPAKALDSADATLTPEDLVHLTRRSLFLVVDADNAAAFLRLQGQEVSRAAFCLMSPSVRPPELGDASKSGSLLTHFLCSPLSAFCLAAGNTEPSLQQLVDLQATLNSVMAEWGALLQRALQAPGSRSPWSAAFRDALLRRLVLRFVLCRGALGLHTAVGSSASHLPRVFPDLPKEVAPDAPEVAAGVARLAACLGRARAFGKRALAVGGGGGSPMSVGTQ
ncbi:MAG: protein SCAI [Monoraphidium minutum]|nr:MAG: protein SCAI [Monoraphidium minutum]